jgi:hypothetical protein
VYEVKQGYPFTSFGESHVKISPCLLFGIARDLMCLSVCLRCMKLRSPSLFLFKTNNILILHFFSFLLAESPSSSASDVDNLNNQSTAAKTVSIRGVHSPQIASSAIYRNNHHLVGLLAYVSSLFLTLNISAWDSSASTH